MSILSQGDQVAALAAHRAALAAQEARERTARLAEARRQEEARFMAANCLAAAVGRLLHRQPRIVVPIPPTVLRDSRATERPQGQRNAA